MEENELYRALEEDFTSTFIRELMPGVLHNFANPLNGIMGRSKLLQRRIDGVVKKISEQYPETAENMQEELQRIKNDIRSVNKETESFFQMFRDASGKFYALAAKGNEAINLSQLLEAEIRFADFYLEFKHEIVKRYQFDNDIPEFKGNTAELSLVFWRLLRFAMNRALESQTEKKIFLKTEHDEENIVVSIHFSGMHISDEQKDYFLSYFKGDAKDFSNAKSDKGILLALMILKKYPAKFQILKKDGFNVILITLSYRIIKDKI